MNLLDLRRVDLNLLIVFEVMMTERNITRTAARLFLREPVVAAALDRLRSLYNDPLFIVIDRYAEPTVRALELESILRPALDSISAALSHTSPFDQATSQEVIRIGVSDDVEIALLPQLLRQLRFEASEMVIIIRRTDYLSVSRQLSSGEISLGICYTGNLPANTRCKALRRSRSVLVYSAREEEVITLDDYCARPHALVSFAGNLTGFIDHELARRGRSRQVKLTIPHFHGLNLSLPGTRLLATVPDYAAIAITADGSLRTGDLPFQVPGFDLSMVWNAAKDFDPAQRWLRGRVLAFLGDEH